MNEFIPCPLSKHELNLLRHFEAGFTSREVADKLFISIDTVRTHRTNILNALGVGKMITAVAMAIRLGWI